MIELGSVEAVLLPDGWHTMCSHSFSLSEHKYRTGDGEEGFLSEVLAVGFSFNDGTSRVAGPSTSILAVRQNPDLV